MDFRFNAQNYDEFEPGGKVVPAGVYLLSVDKVEYVQAEADKKYVKVELSVLGGDYNGSKVYDVFNMVNKSPKAEEIGKKRFAQFLKGIGKPQIESLADLMACQNQKCEAEVDCVKDTYQGQTRDKNKIVKFYHEGNKPVSQPQSASNDEIF